MLSIFRFVCVLLLMSLGFPCMAQGKRKLRGEVNPVHTRQLEIAKALMKTRVPAFSVSKGSGMNKMLNMLERHLAKNGLELEFTREKAESDFEEPLEDAKFKSDLEVRAGTCAEVLKELCRRTKCDYCIREDRVEVFKEKNKQITRRRFLPSPMLEKYTRIEYRRDKDNEHTIGVINEFTGHNAPNLRVKMEYDYDSGCLTMTGNSWHDIQKINMKLDDYYYTWLRSSEAADYMATGAKDKNNKHLSALATHPIIPIEFNACPLSHALAYLNLHTSNGALQPAMRFSASNCDPDDIELEGLDLRHKSLLDAFLNICDATSGHYIKKNSRFTIIPRTQASRTYYLTKYGKKKLSENIVETSKASFEKSPRRGARKPKENEIRKVSDKSAMAALKQIGIPFPKLSSLTYNEKTNSIEVTSSLQCLRHLDGLVRILFSRR